MHVGDIVAIDVDIIPGLDEWANREDAEDVFVRGKYGRLDAGPSNQNPKRAAARWRRGSK